MFAFAFWVRSSGSLATLARSGVCLFLAQWMRVLYRSAEACFLFAAFPFLVSTLSSAISTWPHSTVR
jgi:hypothetical protein